MSEPIDKRSPCAESATPAEALGESEVRHVTHVECDGAGRHYFWCEADDCYAVWQGKRRRYGSEGEAFEAAAEHERNPG